MSLEIKTVNLNGEEYIKKSDVEKLQKEVVQWTGQETLASRLIGSPVIVRDRNEGVNIGIVVLADETGVELSNARRLYYHKPADVNLSWYEGVAISGLGEGSKVSGTVETKLIISGNYSMTKVKDEIYNSIMEVKPNGQN